MSAQVSSSSNGVRRNSTTPSACASSMTRAALVVEMVGAAPLRQTAQHRAVSGIIALRPGPTVSDNGPAEPGAIAARHC
jgi:hypothetical protein